MTREPLRLDYWATPLESAPWVQTVGATRAPYLQLKPPEEYTYDR